MFKTINRDQTCFLPTSMRDAIDENDEVFTLINVVEKLNTKELESKYDSLGQNSYHPKMMIAILYYAYSQGVFASRQIHERLRYDIRYMYLAGQHKPSFNRICEFRREHIDQIKQLFVQIARICQELGIALLNSISIDGSKISSPVSGKKSKDMEKLSIEYADIAREISAIIDHAEKVDQSEQGDGDSTDEGNLADIRLSELKEREQLLGEAISKLNADPKQQRINLTDLECREQKGIGFGYNVQIAVDSESQVILAADITPDPNDIAQLIPMIEQVESNTDTKRQPMQINADTGYASGRALQYLDSKHNITAYIPNRQAVGQLGTLRPLFDKSNFDFNLSAMTCVCPLGEPMRRLSVETRRGVETIKFKGTTCPTCCARFLCTRSKHRQVRMTMADKLAKAMDDRMATSSGKRAMALRRQSVEAVFGQLKEQLGFRKFSLRGLSKVKGEFALLCSAFNIKKLHKYLNYNGKAGSLSILGQLSLKAITSGRLLVHLPRLFVFLRQIISRRDSMNWIHAIS